MIENMISKMTKEVQEKTSANQVCVAEEKKAKTKQANARQELKSAIEQIRDIEKQLFERNQTTAEYTMQLQLSAKEEENAKTDWLDTVSEQNTAVSDTQDILDKTNG